LRVKIVKEVRVAGEDYYPGEILDLDDNTVRRLVELGYGAYYQPEETGGEADEAKDNRELGELLKAVTELKEEAVKIRMIVEDLAELIRRHQDEEGKPLSEAEKKTTSSRPEKSVVPSKPERSELSKPSEDREPKVVRLKQMGARWYINKSESSKEYVRAFVKGKFFSLGPHDEELKQIFKRHGIFLR